MAGPHNSAFFSAFFNSVNRSAQEVFKAEIDTRPITAVPVPTWQGRQASSREAEDIITQINQRHGEETGQAEERFLLSLLGRVSLTEDLWVKTPLIPDVEAHVLKTAHIPAGEHFLVRASPLNGLLQEFIEKITT